MDIFADVMEKIEAIFEIVIAFIKSLFPAEGEEDTTAEA